MEMTEQYKQYLIASRQLRELRAVFTLRELRAVFGLEGSDIPVLEKPYTRMLGGIEAEGYVHDQSTFGKWEPGKPICGTPICTAGHLVAQAGEAGWKLKKKLGDDWALTATFLHNAAHPDKPAQNYGNIKQEHALAYVRQMAEFEAEA